MPSSRGSDEQQLGTAPGACSSCAAARLDANDGQEMARRQGGARGDRGDAGPAATAARAYARGWICNGSHPQIVEPAERWATPEGSTRPRAFPERGDRARKLAALPGDRRPSRLLDEEL